MIVLEITQVACSVALGLLVGSWLTEALVLVPFWRTMEDQKFRDLYADLGVWIYKYFAPLTAIATLLALLTTLLPFAFGTTPNVYQCVSLGLVLLTLGMFAIYFKKSIANFKAGIVSEAGLSSDLAKWAQWHSVRVLIGMVAFISSILAQ